MSVMVDIGSVHKSFGTPEVLKGIDLPVRAGGRQQRAAIARAPAPAPTVLLFDEPTSALDPEPVGELLDGIRDLARQRTTTIIVSHGIGFAREVADTVVFMADGRIVEAGPPARVLDAPREERTRTLLSKAL